MNNKGFTLAETLVAVAIIGSVIVAVLGVFIIGFDAIKKGGAQRDVTYLIEKKLSEVRVLYDTYPFEKYPNVTHNQINEIVTNVSEILPSANPVPLWYASSLTSLSGTERLNGANYNFIISFYSDIDEIKQVGIVITWSDPVTGAGKHSSSTMFITKEF